MLTIRKKNDPYVTHGNDVIWKLSIYNNTGKLIRFWNN